MKQLLLVTLALSGILLYSCTSQRVSTSNDKSDTSVEATTHSNDYRDTNLTIEERVEALLPLMSIEEKVAQMRIFHANIGTKPDKNGNLTLSDKVVKKLKLGIAGVKNPGDHISPVAAAKLNNELQKYIIENNRWGIPALFVTESYNGVDAEGCTKFGRPLTSAASFNPGLVNRMWDVVGREARLRGMHMCHSPEADIVRDPRFGRMSEAFGEDTYLTTQMVINAIKGVQGDYEGLGNGTHIGAVAKHFAGYGQVLGGAVKEARTLGVMASHGDLNGIATHGNKALLTGILRELWGFLGYVVSDSNDIARLFYFMNVAESPEEAALLGLEAGIDIDLYAEDSYSYLPEMVKTNPEIEELIDRSVRRMFESVVGSDIQFVSEKGFQLTDQKKGNPNLLERDPVTIDKMVSIANNADVCILFLGGDEYTAKEAYFKNTYGDRATIEPVGAQDELVEKIKALGKPVIVVLKHRRTLAINTIAEQADAILDTWDLSEFGDESTAKIIFGETSPSGKSPVTIPRSIGQLPFHYSMKEINYKKGYLFLEDGPIYPFGHGLSYTTFEYSEIVISDTEINPNTELEVSVTVKNTGKVKGKEVIQMYIKDEIGSVTRPDKELKAFEKIELDSGESKRVSFKITPNMLEFTGMDMTKILEAGDYTVMIGTSSNQYLETKFRLNK